MDHLPGQLSKAYWLDQISETARHILLASAKELSVPRETEVYHQGDEITAIYYVQEGVLEEVRVNPDGRQISLRRIAKGHGFGEPAVFFSSVAPSTVKAVTPVKLLVFLLADVRAIGRQNPEILEGMVKTLSSYTLSLIDGLDLVLLSSPKDRIVWRLKHLGASGHRDSSEWVSVRISQEEFAALTGTTRQFANKELNDLAGKGLVELGYGSIRIHTELLNAP